MAPRRTLFVLAGIAAILALGASALLWRSSAPRPTSSSAATPSGTARTMARAPLAVVREKVHINRPEEADRAGEPAGENEIVTGPHAQQVDERAYPRTYVESRRAVVAARAFAAAVSRSPRAGLTSWQELGPQEGNVPAVVTYTGRPTIGSGRITALAIDPLCGTAGHGCRLWVGAAGGGVWRSADALADTPAWEAVDNGLTSNAIGSLLVDPTDPTGNTIYAGTGEPNGSSDSEAGLGLFRSTDGGDHWSLVPGSWDVAHDRSISSIAVDPTDGQTIWIGTALGRHGASAVNGGRRTPPGAPALGVYRSTNGGGYFTLQLSRPPSPEDPADGGDFFQGGVTKLVFDPADPGQLYASVTGYGIFRTGNPLDPSGFQQVYQTRYPDDAYGARLEFDAVTHSGTTRLYVGDSNDDFTDPDTGDEGRAVLVVADGANQTPASSLLAASLNSTSPWSTKSSSNPADPAGFSSWRFCQGQCGYDIFVVADKDPSVNGNVVWLGGSMNYGELAAFGGAPVTNGRAVIRSTDGGASFTDMTNDTQDPPLGMHPDQHALVLNPSAHGQAFVGSDGGLVRTNGTFVDNSAQCADRSLSGSGLALCQSMLRSVPERLDSLNAGLNTLQFQSVSVNPQSPLTDVMGGTQDNGTWMTDDTSWLSTIGGDGGQSGFNVAGNVRMHTFYFASGDVNFANGDPEQWLYVTGPQDSSGESFSFYVPFIADPVVDGTWFMGGQSVWRTKDNGGTPEQLAPCNEVSGTVEDSSTCGDFVRVGTALSDDPSNYIAALARSASDSETLWIGMRQGQLYLSRNAAADDSDVAYASLTNSALPGRFISGIAVDPADANHAYVSFSGYSAYTPDTPGHVFDARVNAATGALSLTDISANIGDQPVTGIAFDSATGDLFAATDFGVLRLPSGTSSWVDAGSGLPRTSTFALTLDVQHRVLYAATHGRGAYRLPLAPVARISGPKQVTVGAQVTYRGSGSLGYGSITRLWTFPDGKTSTRANPTWIPRKPGKGYVSLRITDSTGATAQRGISIKAARAT